MREKKIDKINIYGVYGVKIVMSHPVRDAMRQLAAIETPTRELRILSGYWSPRRGKKKNTTLSKNVNSPFKNWKGLERKGNGSHV